MISPPSTTTPAAPRMSAAAGIKIHPIPTASCFAYLLWDPATSKAALVDPRLDRVEDYRNELRERGLLLELVIDTHTHADHISGAAELRRQLGSRVMMSEAAHSEVATDRLKNGDEIKLGNLSLRVCASPGHTDDSLSLYADGHLLSGDALLIGGAGRTDFQNGSPEELFATLHVRFADLPGDTIVHPGHDYNGRTHTTLSQERESNPLFRIPDGAAMRTALTAKRFPKPADMEAILKANIAGLRPAGTISESTLVNAIRGPRAPFLLDVRTPMEFRAQHLDGAISIPLDVIDRRSAEIPSNRDVVIVCRTGSRARLAAAKLNDRDVRVLEGGMVEWLAAGHPVIEGPKHMSLERQVRVASGAIAGVGGVLAVVASPWFGVIPGFVGAGLVFAGLTDRCGMALVLAKLPWNQVATEAESSNCAAPVAGNCAASLPADQE